MESENMFKTLHNGNIRDFEYLVCCYEKKIFGFIFNMVQDYYLTQDLVQDVFVNVYKNLYKYNSEYPIEPWLFKIAYNIVLNYIKKNKLKNSIMSEYTDINDVISRDIFSNIETKYIILKELEKFKKDTKVILLLRIMNDLSFEQIAQIIGTSTSSVKLKFYRGRKVLIENLKYLFEEV